MYSLPVVHHLRAKFDLNHEEQRPESSFTGQSKLWEIAETWKHENVANVEIRNLDLERAGISSVEYINNFLAGKSRFTFSDFALGYLNSYLTPYLIYFVMAP